MKTNYPPRIVHHSEAWLAKERERCSVLLSALFYMPKPSKWLKPAVRLHQP